MINKKQVYKYLSQYENLYPKEDKVCHAFNEALDGNEDSFFSRDNFNPGHITASCFVVTPQKNNTHLLLIYHKTLKRWLQPGGHIELSDENIENAARRELEEETGIGSSINCAGLIDLDIHTIPAKNAQPSHQHFDMRFLFISDKKPVTAGSDVYKAKWVSVAKITPENSDQSIIRALGKTSKLLI